MKKMAFRKYRPYPRVDMPGRSWPDKAIEKAPVWCSIDLRDGNQALSVPMNVDEKMEMFGLLADIGFKEIEVGFPSASQIEFDFLRKLIDEDRIPPDVTVQVLTQAREDLIRRTFDSLKGAKKAIVHLYNSTSAAQRRVVFGKNKAGVAKIAVDGARLMRGLKEEAGNPGIRFEYSPESFPGTELDYALEICRAVMDVWKPGVKDKVIINLPETQEMCTPNVYADRIEWFIRHLPGRDRAIISVHTHNDRGCGVAAAELAVMAGAERVEGALFGNGERTGNMDIITMAMNLFSQGVDPRLDFSDINRVIEVYRRCTRMEVHPRHPYAGDLVYTAFSGSHQDAINKGMKARKGSKNETWDVPYLPIDPADMGRTYESIIRINSQSGKGGVAYILENDWGINIPKGMQRDFADIVQRETERSGKELSSRQVYDCFVAEYLEKTRQYELVSCKISSEGDNSGRTSVSAVVRSKGKDMEVKARGDGPVDAFIQGLSGYLKAALEVVLYSEHALTGGSAGKAIAYIGIRRGADKVSFGAGVDANISVASIKAIICALGRYR